MAGLFVAALLIFAICSYCAKAFAVEEHEIELGGNSEGVVAVKVGENGHIIGTSPTTNTIDQTFYFTTTHRGSDRTYSSDRIQYAAKITDANGNPVGNQVSIDLKDYYGSTQYTTVYADGIWHGYSIPVVPGRRYYFYYKNEGQAVNLKIRMIIEG